MIGGVGMLGHHVDRLTRGFRWGTRLRVAYEVMIINSIRKSLFAAGQSWGLTRVWHMGIESRIELSYAVEVVILPTTQLLCAMLRIFIRHRGNRTVISPGHLGII